MKLETRDCVVIGGGPAGSTYAAILRKYAPGVAVTILEQARFPRYHVGESTIPAANGIMRDLGVFEALERSTFVKKMGVVFIWGRDRQPWTADFLRLRDVVEPGGSGEIVDVTGQDHPDRRGKPQHRDRPFTGFNVRRAEFDELLLNQARAYGAEVREGTRVADVVRDRSGAVDAVRWTNDRGGSGVILTPFVFDASGLTAVLTRDRERDPHMNNLAVYGYLAGADWKVTFNGTRERSTVFIATVDIGWIWYFPVGADMMSVGVVTRREGLARRLRGRGLERFWWDTIRSCPEVAELVRGASLRSDVLPGGKRVAASQDWSNWACRPTGPGWAAGGDSAVFVDPVLSSGVTLAMQSGHRAAYTFNTARLQPELEAGALWKAYADYIRGEAASFLTLGRYFYGNNRAADSWWWEGQRLVNRTGRLALGNQQAFTMAAAGFFPVLRSISPGVVGSLIEHLADVEADVRAIVGDAGVPASKLLSRCAMEVVVPFTLDLRTEPLPENKSRGQLEVFYDLVPGTNDMAHRLAALPCRIPCEMAPIVEAIPQHQRVRTLLDAAPALVPDIASDAAIRRSTLDIIRLAAMKGFLRLSPAQTSSS
jgi:clorobiocin biosynthesis protein Clo-hal